MTQAACKFCSGAEEEEQKAHNLAMGRAIAHADVGWFEKIQTFHKASLDKRVVASFRDSGIVTIHHQGTLALLYEVFFWHVISQ